MTQASRILVLVMLAAAMQTSAFAVTIFESLGGLAPGGPEWFGQALTTPSGGPWDDITFSFSGSDAGTAYIFSSPYGGSPAGLSSSSYLAKSTGLSTNAWVFSPSFTLQPNTTYYLYADTEIADFYEPGVGTLYFSTASNQGFVSLNGTLNFQLSGDVVSGVPEPSTVSLCLCAFGVVTLAGSVWRRRHAPDPEVRP